jgi:hypothetical protein
VELGGGVVGIEGVELDLIKSETAGDMSEADHELLAPTLEDVLGVNAESWLWAGGKKGKEGYKWTLDDRH